MKKLLMVANQYPPLGGSGVQRSCKFVKYLPDFDFIPIVLTRTVKGGLTDQTLLEDVGEHPIERTFAYDMGELPGLLGRGGKLIQRKLSIPDADYLWSKGAYKKALRLIKEQRIEYLYTTSFPYSDHLLGIRLKKRFPHLTWIADFRDEWTKNPYILDMNYSSFRQRLEKRMEREVIESCDGFITNTQCMLNNFLEDYPELRKKATVIPNGYDDDDFSEFDLTHHYKEQFVVTYTGAMYGRRKPNRFFQAIRELMDEGLVDPADIKLRFIGNLDMNRMNRWMDEYNVRSFIELIGYQPHKESIRQLILADVLLLIIGEGPGAKNFASGKIFEYINCNRPILGLVPSGGEAESVINQTESGICASSDSVEDIKEAYLTLYKRWKEKTLIREPNREIIKTYHRKALTKRLVEHINQAEQ